MKTPPVRLVAGALMLAAVVTGALRFDSAATVEAVPSLTDQGCTTDPASAPTAPECPRVVINTDFAAFVASLSASRTVYQVANDCAGLANCSTDLQSVLNAASPGDEIVLRAGDTFIAPAEGFVLPAKPNPSSAWIYMRTSNLAGIPAAGTRAGPAHASAMPKILSGDSLAALRIPSGANRWRLVGIEVSVTSTAMPDANTSEAQNSGLILSGSDSETVLANFATHIVFDRMFIHGHPTMQTGRGIYMNSAHTALIDSHVSEFHFLGRDSQAVAAANTPGPLKIVNNYLEGAGENLIIGGGNAQVPGMSPSDIEIRRNYLYKPLRWKVGDPSFAGYHWTVKNLLELKHARRVIVEANVLENNWPHGQDGDAMLFQGMPDDSGLWAVVTDVAVVRNYSMQTARGASMCGNCIYENQGADPTLYRIDRVRFSDNVFETNGDRLFSLFYTRDVVFDHNTAMHPGALVVTDGEPSVRFVFTNNAVTHNETGIFGSGLATGDATIAHYFPGAVVTKNILMGGNPSQYSTVPGNYFPTSWTGVMIDQPNGNYRIVLAANTTTLAPTAATSAPASTRWSPRSRV